MESVSNIMNRTNLGAKLLSLLLVFTLAVGFVPIVPRTALATDGDTTDVPAAQDPVAGDVIAQDMTTPVPAAQDMTAQDSAEEGQGEDAGTLLPTSDEDTSALAEYVTDETFNTSVGETVMTDVEKREGGYSYTKSAYDPTNPDADSWGYVYIPTPTNLYVVTVPAGTETVNLDFNNNQTWVYNYSTFGAWLSGYYSEYGSGPMSATVSVDVDKDGAFDVIQVQNPYAIDYSGGEVRFAVTFEYDDASAPGAEATDPTTYTASLQGLSDRFVSGGENHAINNDTWAAAVALNDLGLGGSIEWSSIIESFASDEAMSAGRMGKYIMALTAAGIDCTSVSVDGVTRDLVAEMEKTTDFDNEWLIYSAVVMLPVYDYGDYTATDDAYVGKLVDVVVTGMSSVDNQTLAQAVLALIPYQDQAGVAESLASAKATLIASQRADGGFAGYSGDTDPDTSAWATAALSALGVNVSKLSAQGASNGAEGADAAEPKTAADYLAGVCYDDNGTIRVNTVNGEPMAASSVLLGLAAVSGQQAGDPDYDVYTANDVTPNIPDDPEADNPKTDDGDNTNPNGTNNGSTNSSSVAKTGDTPIPYVLVAVFAAAAAVVFVVLRRGHEGK